MEMLIGKYLDNPPTYPHEIYIGPQKVTLGNHDGIYVDVHSPGLQGAGIMYTWQSVDVKPIANKN